MTLGSRMRQLRQQHRLTLQQLGTRCHISVSHLSEIERSVAHASAEKVLRIASALDIAPAVLTADVDDWDTAHQAALDGILSAGRRTSAPPVHQELAQPPFLPPGLAELRDDPTVGAELTPDWLAFLSRLSFQGRQPTTTRGWLGLYMALRPYFDEGPREPG